MIEVSRPSLGLPMLWPDIPAVVAIASDGDADFPLPVLDLWAPVKVSVFVCEHLGVRPSPPMGNLRS